MCKTYDICLIGLGPAGIGFLSSLRESELKNLICFDKGSSFSSVDCQTKSKTGCMHCQACKIISGLGGASRFSNGKLSTYPAGSGLSAYFDSPNSLENFMDSELSMLISPLELKKIEISESTRNKAESFFGLNGIKYKFYDIYEFQKENYCKFINDIVNRVSAEGTIINYNTVVKKIERLTSKNDSLFSIHTLRNGITQNFLVKKIVIATGNIIHDLELNNFDTEGKIHTSYELGVRVLLPTYKLKKYLDTHGDLKLKYKNGRTFCVSKNGYIIAYSTEEMTFLEGYANRKQPSNMTNFAVLIKDTNKLSLEQFKKTYKDSFKGIPIKQTFEDYLNNKESVNPLKELYTPVQAGNIKDLLPQDINSEIVDFINHVLIETMTLSAEDITLLAPELKESYIVDTDNQFQLNNNCFVIGAATGRFRGIFQSFCSGIRCAQIIRR